MEEELAVVQQQQQNPDLLMVGVSTCIIETPLKNKIKLFYIYF